MGPYILASLAQGPRCGPQLAAEFGATVAEIAAALDVLRRQKLIKFLGWVQDARLQGYKSNAIMWGLRGRAHYRAVEANGDPLRCPACHSQVIIRMPRYLLRCQSCSTVFHPWDQVTSSSRRESREQVSRSCGSGKIAGIITIGRGTRWGASLL